MLVRVVLNLYHLIRYNNNNKNNSNNNNNHNNNYYLFIYFYMLSGVFSAVLSIILSAYIHLMFSRTSQCSTTGVTKAV